ncbi:MAG TPA: intradiol ring-cleavage dioxygenase [Methylomirabilota bacterium]|nr:intradiol ring-cleavage dioxygenase [Methylomirabilota bacterium]
MKCMRNLVAAILVVMMAAPAAAQGQCAPTRPDAEGPFYQPNAPRRTSIGTGFIVQGTVRSARGCTPIPGARIEWWQANPRGEYDDQHRATMASDQSGSYRLETSFPPPYAGRPPHIHVKVFAPRHRPLTTQLYPKPGQKELSIDFVVLAE